MDTVAVLIKEPEQLVLGRVDLIPPGDEDVVVDVEWSGISTGTERLLWLGRMPHFPGMGYPLVPGYESVGRVAIAGPRSDRRVGDQVFVPGARCFKDVRCLFGGAAAQVVVPGARALPIDERMGEQGVLLALAATAYHAIAGGNVPPDLIVGHGVLGRLLARLALTMGNERPVVWERDPARLDGADGYPVLDPDDDKRSDYRAIYDASGDASALDSFVARLGQGGEIILAGFYSEPLSFTFPPAFMREARFRIAAEWREPDLMAVKKLVESNRLSLDGLITHRQDAAHATDAYLTAFNDPTCLKMILNWSAC
jgi:bacteriochlorophyllide a dehydrogenase